MLEKKTVRRTAAAILLLAVILSLAGCSAIDTEGMEQRVRTMLDCFINEDLEGSYAMLYPGTVDEETYRAIYQQLRELFPIVEGYTLNPGSYNLTTRIGTQTQTIETAQYSVEFDGKQYVLDAVYVSDNTGNGFTTFHISIPLQPGVTGAS